MLRELFLLAFAAVVVTAIESNFHHEEPCGEVKGFCVLKSECPHALEVGDEELCSMQKGEGAVCCRNFPQDQANCRQLHNACMEGCADNLNLGAKGCKNGQTCCVLV